MEQLGRTLVWVGLGVAAIGALMWLGVFRWLRLGRLPGDIAIERPGFSVYVPVVSMLLVSAVLSFLLWLVGVFRK